jgi:hypothetical protein
MCDLPLELTKDAYPPYPASVNFYTANLRNEQLKLFNPIQDLSDLSDESSLSSKGSWIVLGLLFLMCILGLFLKFRDITSKENKDDSFVKYWSHSHY